MASKFSLFPLFEALTHRMFRRLGAESRILPIPQGRLHLYDVPGQGLLPPLVLLHGVGSSAQTFLRMLRPLQRGFSRVILPDTPGHGRSHLDLPEGKLQPREVFQSLASGLAGLLQGQKAIVFGNSLGGGMALRLSLDHPEIVQALVLSSPAGAKVEEEDFRAFLRQFEMASSFESLDFLRRLFHRPPWYARLIAPELQRLFQRPQIRSFFDSISESDLFSPDDLQTIPCPTLFLWGLSEKIMPESHFEYFKAHFPPHVIIERPPGVGHCPQIEQPASLARRILAFAHDLEPSR